MFPSNIGYLVLSLTLGSHVAKALSSWSIGSVNECGNLVVNWEGSKGDLNLVVVPTKHGDNQNLLKYTIPSTASPPYTIKGFPQPSGTGFMASLWDDEGADGADVIDVQTVGSSSNTTCYPPSLSALDFLFDFTTFTPSTCSPLSITWSNNFTGPGSILLFQPEASVRELEKVGGSGEGRFDWMVDVPGGRGMAVVMLDSGPVGHGGSSELLTVRAGSDTSCVRSVTATTMIPYVSTSAAGSTATSQTVSATSAKSSETATSGSGSGSGSENENEGGNESGGSKTNIGVIMGPIAAAVLIILLGLLFLRRRKRNQNRHKQYAGDLTRGEGGGGDPSASPSMAWLRRGGSTVGTPEQKEQESDEGHGTIVPFLTPGAGGSRGTATATSSPGTEGPVFSDANGVGGYSPDALRAANGDIELNPYWMPAGSARSTRPEDMARDSVYSGMARSSDNGARRESGVMSAYDGYGTGDSQSGRGDHTPGGTFSDRYRDNVSPGSPNFGQSQSPGSPLRLVGAVSPAGNPSGQSEGMSSKRRRMMADMEQERPETIVRHEDAGMIEDAMGTQADPAGVVHLPPAYDEAMAVRRS